MFSSSIEKEGGGHDNVGDKKDGAFEPVGLEVVEDDVDDDQNHDEHHSLKCVEVKVEMRKPKHPTDDHHKWRHKSSDLNAGSNRNSNRQVQLTLHCHCYRTEVLCCIAHNRQQDHAHKKRWQPESICKSFHRIHKVLRSPRHEPATQNQNEDCNRNRDVGHFLILILIILSPFKQILVSHELVEQVHKVEREKSDGRHERNAIDLLMSATCERKH
mmetsp:Transcript_4780/g.10207  ORF Transcript_4780/g.10207 Transcript_4780/m.10207 type:complete len:215 (-) Transcript_4780:515-1159(-)